MNDCTTTDCGNGADLYLCNQCVGDLQLWLDKVTETRQMLFTTMAKLDNTGPKNSEGGGGGSTGSAMPLRDGAMDLRYALAIWAGHSAKDLARDAHAAGYLEEIKQLIDRAYELVDGPKEKWTATCTCGEVVVSTLTSATCTTCGTNAKKVDLQAARARKAAPDLLNAKELVSWIKTFTGKDVTENQIYIWANRGLIPQAQTKPPLYDPLAVAVTKGLYKHAS